jgi:hypothetical protein
MAKKSLIQVLDNFFAKLFGGIRKLEKFLSDHLDFGVALAGNVRNYVEGLDQQIDSSLTLQLLLPAKWLNKIDEHSDKIKLAIDKVMLEAGIGQECLAKETFDERLACLIVYIRGLSDKRRSEIYKDIAKEVTRAKSGMEVKDNRLNYLLEGRLLKTKENL